MSIQRPAICRVCLQSCGLLVSRTDGKLSISGNPEHPVSKGFICFKGKQFGHVHDAPDRLTTPLLKCKSGWKAVSYPDALDLMCERFETSRRAYGAQSVAILKGESLKHQEVTNYIHHLAHGFGTPNAMSIGSLCQNSLVMAHTLTYGGIPGPEYDRTRSAILWGCNPAESMECTFARIRRAKAEGLKVMVVDPARTRTAAIADLHLPVVPGTDGRLALAFIKHFSETAGLCPEAQSSVGWERMRDELAAVPLDRLLAPTGISAALFDQAAAFILENGPTWIKVGLGLELQPAGVQTIRAVACLQGLIDPARRTLKPWGRLKPLPGRESYPRMPPAVGETEYPCFMAQKGEGQAMRLPRAILENDPYPVRSLFVAGANPMLTFPDPVLFEKALRSLDFLAVFDLFMTETARLADLVLPAVTHLEHVELHDYFKSGHPCLGLVRPVDVTGKGQAIATVILEMAKRLGLRELFPWDSNEQAIAERMRGSPVSYEDLAASPSLTVRYDAPEGGPGPVIRFHSDALHEHGLSGIPGLESLAKPLEPDGDYPFFLSTGDKLAVYQHSQFRNIPRYRRLAPGPTLDMHPQAASGLGLADGEAVVVSTPWGRLEVCLAFDDGLRPDCLRLVHGWAQANVNRLGAYDHLDPVSGYPWLRAMPARICKREDAAAAS